MFGTFCFFLEWVECVGMISALWILEFLNFGVIWNWLEWVVCFLFFWEWFGFLWTDVFFRVFLFYVFYFLSEWFVVFFDFVVWMIQKVWYLWVSVSFECSGMFWKVVWIFWHDVGRFWMCWKLLECFGVCSGSFPNF